MTNLDISRSVKRRAIQIQARCGMDCHVSVSQSVLGEIHILFATPPYLRTARDVVISWSLVGVPVECCERHAASLDRKIRQQLDGVMDGA